MMLGLEKPGDDIAPEDDLDLYDAAEAITPGAAAAVVVLEHTWAIPLRDAIVRTGGRPTASEWVDADYLAKLGVNLPQ